MNKIFITPPKSDWQKMLQRPAIDYKQLETQVASVLEDVRLNGDSAVKKFTQLFDGVSLDDLKVSRMEIAEAVADIDADLKTAARNFIILLQEKLEKTVAHTTVEEEIKKVFNDNDFLKKTIEIVLHEFSRLGGTENNIEILLPAKEKEDLSKWFIGMFHQKAFNNVNVHFTEKVSFGFKIGIQDTGKHFNFGGGMVEAFQEFCSPRFRKYFLSENEG